MEQGYWNNERIAVALERIADKLDFFEELAKKEMAEEDKVKEDPRPVTGRQTDSLYFSKEEFSKLYFFVKDYCNNYGFCRLGDVKEKFERGIIVFTDFKIGWINPNQMIFNELDDDRIELVCSCLVRRKDIYDN